MSITIKKIAELANVSRGTVDRVIHGRGGVSIENHDKIKNIIKKYNYKSNRDAQALATSKNIYNVGVVINSIGNEFFDSVLDGLIYEAKKHSNINLVIRKYKGYEESKQLEAIKNVLDDNVHAIIINPINTKKIIDKLSSINIPIVTMNNDIDVDKLGFVGCDYFNNGQLSGDVANIALENGGNVAVIVGSYNIRGHVERIEGFKSVFNNINSNVYTYENQDDDEQSYDLTKRIVQENNVSLIYYAAAGISGGLKALEELNSKIKVITVDETMAVRKALSDGRILATITQQPYKQGSRSIQLVRDYLVYNSTPKEKQNLTGNKVQLRNMKFTVENK